MTRELEERRVRRARESSAWTAESVRSKRKECSICSDCPSKRAASQRRRVAGGSGASSGGSAPSVGRLKSKNGVQKPKETVAAALTPLSIGEACAVSLIVAQVRRALLPDHSPNLSLT